MSNTWQGYAIFFLLYHVSYNSPNGFDRVDSFALEFLISGKKVQRVDGVILLDWSDRSLERQIQLGARTGDIDINLARFEMINYRSNIIPVAQFFDQQGQLHIVIIAIQF